MPGPSKSIHYRVYTTVLDTPLKVPHVVAKRRELRTKYHSNLLRIVLTTQSKVNAN